jgi:putative inorganic carbon (hco3(-)) transporter
MNKKPLIEILSALGICLMVGAIWYIQPHPVLVIAFGLLPLGVILVINRPYIFVVAFVIFSFFRIHEAFYALYPLHIPQLLAIASLATLLWHFILSRRIQPYWSQELSWFALFFVLVTIGIAFATNRSLAINNWSGVYVKIAIMTLALVWLTREVSDFSLMARMVVLAGMAVGGVALFNKVNGIGLVEGTRVTIGRDFGSILGDPNDLALVMLFPASFALSLMTTPRLQKIDRLLGWLGFFVVLGAIIATQSRGGLLGIAAVMGLTATRVIKSKTVLMALGGLALLILFAVAGISGRSSGGASEQGVDESAMGRIYAWGAATKMGITHPLTGVGIDNFYVNYYRYSSHWDGKNHAVHSTWFSVLAETGLLGLGIFLTLVTVNVRTAYKTIGVIDKQPQQHGRYPPMVCAVAQAVMVGLVGFLISGTFLNQSLNWPFYVLLALNVATARFINKAATKANNCKDEK